jgi:hypothetical protein
LCTPGTGGTARDRPKEAGAQSYEPTNEKHGAPPPVDKLLPGYLFFFFSCLASFFSLAVFCGFFFPVFFVSSDLDMWLPSLVQAQDFTTISFIATKYK